MNNAVFGKTNENARIHKYIRLVTTNKKRSKLVSESNYHTTKWFRESLIRIEMKNIKVLMNKPIYLGLSILDLSKTVMYVFWYNYMKPKYQNNAKLCYMDTDSFVINIKTENFYKDIVDDVEEIFDISNYEYNSIDVNRSLHTEKNNKVIGPMKDDLGGKIMTEFVA